MEESLDICHQIWKSCTILACLVLVSLAPVHPLEKVQGTEQDQQKELQNVSSPDVSFFLFVVFVVVECTVFVLHWLEFNFLISCSFLLYTCSSTSLRLFVHSKGRFFCLILLGQQHFRKITVCAIYFMNQNSILFLSFPFLLIISGFIIHHKKACSSKFPWASFLIRVCKR